METYVLDSHQYYDRNIINTISNSRLMSDKNLRLTQSITLNFLYQSTRQEFVTFRNGVFRITTDGIRKATSQEICFHIHESKRIPHDFTPTEAPFKVHYSEKYNHLLAERDSHPYGSPVWHEVNDEIRNMPDLYKYRLEKAFDEKTVSYIRFLYNTGRMYWKKEQSGEPLTWREQQEYDIHFINKCWCIGYLLRKHKTPSTAIGIYALEANLVESGQSEGRSGKSVMFKYLAPFRNVFIRGMRNLDLQRKSDTLLSGLNEHHDIVMFDDLEQHHQISSFFPDITGDMTVRQLHRDPIIIPFAQSPKVVFTSNYAQRLDGSTRGRLNFCSFSNYYHADTPSEGLREFTPAMEFGKDMIDDYTTDENNQLYNFFCACIQLHMQFPEKITPPMESLELRSLVQDISRHVFDWFNEFFATTGEGENSLYLNCPLDRSELLEAYKKAYSDKYASSVTIKRLKHNLEKYCAFRGWILNPDNLYRSDNERQIKAYRRYLNGADRYIWYVATEKPSTEYATRFKGASDIEVAQIKRNPQSGTTNKENNK